MIRYDFLVAAAPAGTVLQIEHKELERPACPGAFRLRIDPASHGLGDDVSDFLHCLDEAPVGEVSVACRGGMKAAEPRSPGNSSICALAASPGGTARGPVLPSPTGWSRPMSSQRRLSTSLRRHPVSASMRIAAISSGQPVSRASRARPSRASSCPYPGTGRRGSSGSYGCRDTGCCRARASPIPRPGTSLPLPIGISS